MQQQLSLEWQLLLECCRDLGPRCGDREAACLLGFIVCRPPAITLFLPCSKGTQNRGPSPFQNSKTQTCVKPLSNDDVIMKEMRQPVPSGPTFSALKGTSLSIALFQNYWFHKEGHFAGKKGLFFFCFVFLFFLYVFFSHNIVYHVFPPSLNSSQFLLTSSHLTSHSFFFKQSNTKQKRK